MRVGHFGPFCLISIALALLAGCASTEEKSVALTKQLDTAQAECTGRQLTQFESIQFALMEVHCGARRLLFTAWPSTRADPHMVCAFTWGPATDHKGNGRLTCDNGRSGAMAYDRSDPKNIKVETRLDDGGRFDFVLHEDKDFPNKHGFPS
jgi:hypothetical protein